MARFVAFLRAINIGGHIVKMERLRQSFEALRLTRVETFIASGNVIFETVARSEAALRKRIEAQLKSDLGYDVPTFLRTEGEVGAVAAHEAFPQSSYRTPHSRLFVGFLAAELPGEVQEALISQSSATDEFRVHGREIYWLCHVLGNESPFSGPKLEKTIRAATTLRNVNTVRRLAQKLAVGTEAQKTSLARSKAPRLEPPARRQRGDR